MDALAEYGYLGLFLASFLAATVLPLSSEVVLVVLLLNHFSPVNTILVATTGNVLGSITNYAIGFWGNYFLLEKLLRYSREDIEKADRRFQKYGIASLLFAWVPIVGDAFTVVAGLLKINFLLFLILVSVGKLVRYIVIVYTTLGVSG